MTRLRMLFLVVAAGAVALLSGCGAASRPAATVSGHDITQQDLTRDLDAIRDNKELRKAATAQLSVSDGTIDARITASWLQSLVQQVAIDREFARRHLRVTAGDRAQAQSGLESQNGFGSKQIFDAFPKSFRDRVVDRQARTQLVGSAVTGSGATANAQAQFVAFLDNALRRGHVWVNSRYGTPQFTQQGFAIAPPAAPNVREKPAQPTTTTTGLPGSSPAG